MKNLIPEFIKTYYRIILSVAYGIYLKNPAKDLKLIGVTGSSGKSTTSSMIFHILRENGFKVGIISTVGAIAGDETIDTGFHVTTPDPIDVQKILKIMTEKGVEYVVIESSSHALEQGRLGLLQFDAVVYTNIKRDHLDWHRTWENYARAKARLIDALKPGGYVVLNRDDPDSFSYLSLHLEKEFKRKKFSIKEYSLEDNVKKIKDSKDHTTFTYFDDEIKVNTIGEYNIENALAAIEVTKKLGLDIKEIIDALKTFKLPTGRMEVMKSEPFIVIVDFAHNADSLEKSLKAARKLVGEKGRLIAVFGSAGLRDVEKRSEMGKISGALADITIVTAEDPRTESLYEINSLILDGTKKSGATLIKRFRDSKEYYGFYFEEMNLRYPCVFVFDEESVNGRYDAIEFAMRIANPGDVIITEGKGHEQTLCFGTTEYPYTDQEAVEIAEERLGL